MRTRFLGFFGLIFLALAVTTAVFFYAKGYRINFNQKTIDGTGIIQIATNPQGAAVFIDGGKNPTQATDVSLTNLKPGKYNITLKKDGYTDWKKEVEVRAGLVTQVEALLTPSAPNLKAITFTGVTNPKFSPDNQKLVYAVDSPDKAGLWTLDISNRPLFFSKDPKQIAKNTSDMAFSASTFDWTPDGKNVLVTINITGKTENFLLDPDNLNQQFADISARLSELKISWQRDLDVKNKNRLDSLGQDAIKLAAGAKQILFSPEEERVLIVKADGSALVYDSKPYLSFDKKATTYNLPKADNYIWYPESSLFGHDSRHLILVNKDSISVIEADGDNQDTLYTGQFDPSAVFPWPDGSKLVILTNLNSSATKELNLYSIDLH